VRGEAPALDLGRERHLQRLMVDLVSAGLIESAHDCAEGGLAVTLAECAFETGGIGADIAVSSTMGDGGVDGLAATLFGESASRVIVSVRREHVPAILDRARAAGVPAERVGRTGGAAIRIVVDGATAIECSVTDAEARWTDALADWLEGRAA
jgi:phosphoribosylformylglycinamidine synthase